MVSMSIATVKSDAGNGTTDARGTSVIVNAIAVLRCFSAAEPLLGVTEIADRVGMHKSTVSRLLTTLEQEELVERGSDGRRYKLGLGLIAMAGPLLAELDERRVAYPILQRLTERTAETSALMVWNGRESMCVEQIPSPQQVKHTAPLGARYRDAMSSSVQVFLSLESEERVRELMVNGTIHFAGLDETGLEAYLVRLADVAKRGYATNYGESSMDEVGVAAPVFDHRGEAVAAVLIPAPRFRVSPEQLQTLGEAAKQCAHIITLRLGGAPTP
ncbi:IclR family transcriptional regulator [Arthrobacter sp.]|uniref:IclR family transcriptional regulator n=1 Tax=Arthrobacter sp. TaxID=1667 RepID=UPI0026E02206|nr:IclR family transcriptional regulator [Arthrobacter sp.]MDO5754551.1 IclR family transcriptional regulator [Arthrobacter sp.]